MTKKGILKELRLIPFCMLEQYLILGILGCHELPDRIHEVSLFKPTGNKNYQINHI